MKLNNSYAGNILTNGNFYYERKYVLCGLLYGVVYYLKNVIFA